jgi:dienelactone hydrolase
MPAHSVRVPAHDGNEFDAHLAVPDRGAGSGMLLLHEAGGITGYMRGVARRLADLGYVTLMPDLFWRVERNVDLQDDKDMTRALELIGQFDPHAGVRDADAALAYLRAKPEVDGPVGVMGFCFGGGLTYGVACELDPHCAVAYYGVGVELLAERIREVTCPTLLQFGTRTSSSLPTRSTSSRSRRAPRQTSKSRCTRAPATRSTTRTRTGTRPMSPHERGTAPPRFLPPTSARPPRRAEAA